MADLAFVFIIPDFIEKSFEDEELVERFGEEHRCHIREKPAIFAQFRDVGSFAGSFS